MSQTDPPSSLVAARSAQSHALRLYDFPLLYDLLRAPCPDLRRLIEWLAQSHLGAGPYSVLDPACGSGAWLAVFDRPGAVLAGNDLAPAMADFARRRLNGRCAVVGQQDMRALDLGALRFDLVLEVSGVVTQLPDRADVRALAGSLQRHARAGGLVVLLAHFEDPTEDTGLLPRVLYEREVAEPTSGLRARGRYVLERVEAQPPVQWMRREVATQGDAGYPAHLEDEYPIHLWSSEHLAEIAAGAPELEPLGVFDAYADDPTRGDAELAGERLLAYRRR